LRSILTRLWRDTSGVSIVEYGLLVATISIGIILTLNSLANNYTTLWQIVATYTGTATNTGSNSASNGG
jgi:Flp pilus assembly pilin Flp